MLRVDGLELLVVATDVSATERTYLAVHDSAGAFKALIQTNRIALGLKAGQELRFEGFHVGNVPGSELLDEIVGNTV